MFELIQPLLTVLLGLALSLLSMVHGYRSFPSSAIWQHVMQSAPQIGLVAAFVLCVLLACTGVAILVTGLRGCRHRLAQLRHLRWSTSSAVPSGHPGYAGEPGYDREFDEHPWQ